MAARTSAAQRAKISSSAVHCIWIVASFVVLAFALVSLGVTCYLVGQSEGPCPRHLSVTVIGVAGALLLISGALFLRVCRKRRLEGANVDCLRNGRTADCLADVLEPLPVNGGEVSRTEDVGSATINLSSSLDTPEFITEQKSAEVSYWIDHQPAEHSDCGLLDGVLSESKAEDEESIKYQYGPLDGATNESKEGDEESIKSERGPLVGATSESKEEDTDSVKSEITTL